MMLQLVRQDPAFRRMPLWIVMATVWASMVAGMIAWATARGGPIGLEAVAALTWISVVLFLVFGEIGTRANSFTLALPITARRLWISHIIAVGVTGLAVLVVSAAMTMGSLILIGKLVEGWQLDTATLVELSAWLLSGLMLSVGIVHMLQPGAQEVPMSLRRVAWSLVAVAVPLGLAVALRPLGPVSIVLVLALAGAAFGRVCRAVPAVLSIPAATRGAVAPAEAAPAPWATTERPAGLWFSLRVVQRVTTCAKKPAAMLVVVPFLAFLGFWTSGIDARWTDGAPRFAYPFMIIYVLMAGTTIPLNGLGTLDWLPWSRRRTLALMVLPFFLLVAVGYGLGAATNALLGKEPGRGELFCFATERDTGQRYLCVSLSACRIAWNGQVPEVTAPWGETHEPWNRSVVRGLPVRVYFPWSVPTGSTDDFAALQLSRAAEALFGADIPPQDIRARYLDATAGEAPSLTLEADYGLHRIGHAVYFPWIMAEVIVLWALLTAGYTRWLRGGASMKKRTAIGAVFIAIPMLFWIADFAMEATGMSRIPARSAFVMSLSHSAGATPYRVAALWVGSALLSWGAYRLVERRVMRAELDPRPLGGKGASV